MDVIKKTVSKVGAKHNKPDVDMMEHIQTTELQEFDLDRDYQSTTCYNPIIDNSIPEPPTGGSGVPVKKKNVRADVENEHNDQLVDEIEYMRYNK